MKTLPEIIATHITPVIRVTPNLDCMTSFFSSYEKLKTDLSNLPKLLTENICAAIDIHKHQHDSFSISFALTMKKAILSANLQIIIKQIYGNIDNVIASIAALIGTMMLCEKATTSITEEIVKTCKTTLEKSLFDLNNSTDQLNKSEVGTYLQTKPILQLTAQTSPALSAFSPIAPSPIPVTPSSIIPAIGIIRPRPTGASPLAPTPSSTTQPPKRVRFKPKEEDEFNIPTPLTL